MLGESMTAPDKKAPNPKEKLVQVFDSDEESEVMVVRGLLESAGIDCDVSNLEAPQNILPGVGGVVILVREEDAAEARAVIKAAQQSAGSSSGEETPAE
jgi:Putative prokaryotic signal transducing protein